MEARAFAPKLRELAAQFDAVAQGKDDPALLTVSRGLAAEYALVLKQAADALEASFVEQSVTPSVLASSGRGECPDPADQRGAGDDPEEIVADDSGVGVSYELDGRPGHADGAVPHESREAPKPEADGGHGQPDRERSEAVPDR